MSWPWKRTRPLVGSRRPVSILTVVLLPAPLGPRYPRISPGRMVKLTESTAGGPMKVLVRLRASSMEGRHRGGGAGSRSGAGGGGEAPTNSLILLGKIAPAPAIVASFDLPAVTQNPEVECITCAWVSRSSAWGCGGSEEHT